MNKVVLMGRLTDDIKVERKGKETIWSNFTIAVRDGQDEEGNSKAQFIRCVIFGKGAEILGWELDRLLGDTLHAMADTEALVRDEMKELGL